jgi:hypothetical protein
MLSLIRESSDTISTLFNLFVNLEFIVVPLVTADSPPKSSDEERV